MDHHYHHKERTVQLATWRSVGDEPSQPSGAQPTIEIRRGPPIPEIVQFLESRERKGQRAPRYRFARQISLPGFLRPLVIWICLWLPKIYMDRHQELQTVVAAESDIFRDSVGRLGAASAWEAYCQGMIDEWQSANIITALILSAAGSFLGLPNLSNASRYALLFAILSSLVAIAHSAVFAHVYRNKLANKHFTIIQLTTYLNYYCFVDNILLCLPLIHLFYAIAAFSVSIILYLWPDAGAPKAELSLAGRIVIISIFGIQILLMALSYLASRELTFTTDELLDASRTRKLAAEMKKEKEADLAQAAMITSMPIVNDSLYVATEVRPSTSRARWLGYDWSVTEVAIPLGYEDGKPEAYMWEHQQLYVVRVFYEGRYRAGKLGWHIGQKRYMYIPFSKYRAEIMLERADCDILCGEHVDFAWYCINEHEHFDAAHVAASIPDIYELFVINPSSDRGELGYVCAATYQGGQQLGEVIDGCKYANIPWLGEELHISPFLILLIRKGALVSRDALIVDLSSPIRETEKHRESSQDVHESVTSLPRPFERSSTMPALPLYTQSARSRKGNL